MKICSMFLFLITLSAGFAQGKSVVRFPEEIEISHQSQYSLLDLVNIENPQPQLLRQLWKAEIPKGWTQGSRWTMSSEQILKVLRKANISRKGVELYIPKSIRPQKSQNILSAVHLKRVISTINQAQCKACEFKIDLHNIPKVLLSEWEWDPFSVQFRGSFTTLIKMPDRAWTGWLTGYVKWKGPVLTARRSISYQERIQESDLEEDEKDITFSKDVVTDKSEIVGQVAGRVLSPSVVLTRTDLKKEPIVKKGQIVKTLMGRDDFEISIVSLAEENGFIGDLVKVKNVDSQKLLSAVVVDRGVVRVQ